MKIRTKYLKKKKNVEKRSHNHEVFINLPMAIKYVCIYDVCVYYIHINILKGEIFF